MTDSADDLPDDIERLKAMLLAERGEKARLADQNERLLHMLRQLRRNHFGRKSERLSEDQLNLGLEDLETAIASGEAATEKADATLKRTRIRERRVNRGHLPAHLPREEVIVEPPSKTCPCCGGALHSIGEDRSERLDKIPAKYRVIVTRRPKYACRTCEKTGADKVAGVIQAPAPVHLVEGGLPTEALVADVVVSKYAWHLPLYRQSQMMVTEGLRVDRSTLAHWVGFAAFELRPVYERLIALLKRSGKLFADETRCPVLDPGRGKTKTGQLWAYARDDRPWEGSDPPGVAYVYAPDRKAERPIAHLAGFTGILQVDGYGGYRVLAEKSGVTLAFCWAHVRRRFYELAAAGPAPIASEALRRIAELYRIEDDVQGRSAEQRRAARQEKSLRIVANLEPWLREKLGLISQKTKLAEAIRYTLSRWEGLSRFLDDGRIEIDSNTVERSIRPIALNRKNALFAGSDGGAEHWAVVASLIETCKLNGVEPLGYLADVLTRIVNGHPNSQIDDLLPWAYIQAPELRAVA